MSQEITVTKHNSLVEASYKLTLNEQRLLLVCISKLDPRNLLPKNNLFTVTAKEFSEIFGIEEKHSYKSLEDAATTIYDRDIKTHDGGSRERFRWVYYVKYHDDEGKITLGFSPIITPYLSMLHEKFTSYKLTQVSRLKSIYSIRLFEMLISFKTTGKFIIGVSKFKKLLEIENQYARFFDLKRWVIDPAIKELQCKSNLKIYLKLIKKGRKIENLFFTFKFK